MQDAMQGLRFWQRRPGATYLLVHGFAGAPESWARVIAELTHGSIVTATLPGHGRNVPVRDGGFTGYQGWLREVVDTLEAGELHVVGYSAGGRVVAAALASGMQCSKASLVSAGLGAATADERKERRAADARWATLLRTAGITAFVDAWEAQPIFASQAAAGTVALAEQRAIRLAHDPVALADAMEAVSVANMPDVSRRLGSGRVQMIVGALDTKYVALAGASGLPTVSLAACGHNPLLEAPAALARALQNFA